MTTEEYWATREANAKKISRYRNKSNRLFEIFILVTVVVCVIGVYVSAWFLLLLIPNLIVSHISLDAFADGSLLIEEDKKWAKQNYHPEFTK